MTSGKREFFASNELADHALRLILDKVAKFRRDEAGQGA